MQKKLFGTDGIRGRFGEFPITVEFSYVLGKALALVLKQNILLGMDPRASGLSLAKALIKGYTSEQKNVDFHGYSSTPMLSYLSGSQRLPAIMISASHNRHWDNGFKFFLAGHKFTPELQEKVASQIEELLKELPEYELSQVALDAQKTELVYIPLGETKLSSSEVEYIEFCKAAFLKQQIKHNNSNNHISNLHIILDCANGATYRLAPAVFNSLAAKVTVINASPNGSNINQNCGSTNTDALVAKVAELGADLGIAFDGDGDRVILVDEQAKIVAGDHILYVLAKYYQATMDAGFSVIGTILSNLALEQKLLAMCIGFTRVEVGDKNIAKLMFDSNYASLNYLLGGEDSGHIICKGLTTNGDGIIAALQVILAMLHFNQSLSELKHGLIQFPQVSINLNTKYKDELINSTKLQAEVASLRSRLSGTGRVVLRASGTEDVIRLMLEGRDLLILQQEGSRLQNFIQNLEVELEKTIVG